MSAGLLVKSFWRLQQVNPGFDATRLTTMLVWPTEEKYAEVAASRAFIRELNARLEKCRARKASPSATTCRFGAAIRQPIRSSKAARCPSRAKGFWSADIRSTPRIFRR